MSKEIDPTAARAAAVSALNGLREFMAAFDHFRLQISARLDISTAEANALSYLLEAGQLTQVDLADKLGITSGGATAMIDRMEEAGLVRRSADPHDRRRRLVQIDGPMSAGILDANAGLSRVFEGMDDAALQALTRDLRELAEKIRRSAESVRSDAERTE